MFLKNIAIFSITFDLLIGFGISKKIKMTSSKWSIMIYHLELIWTTEVVRKLEIRSFEIKIIINFFKINCSIMFQIFYSIINEK